MQQYTLEDFSSSGVECPTCGKSDFDSDRAMAIHHKASHGESITQVERECNQCGGSFEIPRCWLKKGGGKFCSKDCQYDWVSENKSGENSPHWKGGPVTVECEWCEAEIERVRANVERSENHFCSSECDAAYKSEHRKGDWVSWWKGGPAICECEYCGEEYERQRSEADKSRFCSVECMAQWQSENWIGENHPGTWKGGHFEYGPGWNDAKKMAVRERDGFECQDCGMSQEEHLEWIDSSLEVHHIIPARSFDDPEKRNAMNNLVTLCRSCHHGKWEQLPGLRPMRVD